MGDLTAVQSNEQTVQEIFNAKDVSTFFQPVASISTKSIVGFEAFSRGGGGAGICTVEPAVLFHESLPSQLKLDIDRLCREKALAHFMPIHDKHKDLLLYLNINPDIFPLADPNGLVLPKQVVKAGVAPENVVLECTLSNQYIEKTVLYREKFKALGFKTCLDNCSVDDSFSHTLSVARPDFVKINRTFFGNEERKDYSSKALEVLLVVAERIGALVVAQGVENEEESIRLLSAGVHLQQGYYYTKDEVAQAGDPARIFYSKIIDTYDKYKFVKRELVRRKKERFNKTFKSVASICAKLSNMSEDRFEDGCKSLVGSVNEVISMFVLDSMGGQITVRAHGRNSRATTNTDSILGTQKGVDHSVMDYVMYLDMGYEKYVTQPFCSPFTGKDACIISRAFFNKEGARYMVCIEMPVSG